MARIPNAPTTSAGVEDIIWRKPVDGDAIHYFVMWDIERVEMSQLRLAEMLRACDLERLDLPPIRQRSSIIRALDAMAENGEDVERIYDDEEESCYAITRYINGTRGQDGRPVARVAQRVSVSVLKAPEDGQEPIVYANAAERALIEPLINRYREAYKARDITTHILSAGVFHAGGIKLRAQGGSYFVPATGAHIVEALRTFVEMLAAEANAPQLHMTTIGVADSGQTRSDIRYHSHKALIAELRAQQAHLRDMLRPSRVDDDGYSSVKDETAERYKREAREVAERAALYRDVAELGLRDINAALRAVMDAYGAVQSGLSEAEFAATLKRVDNAINDAEEAREHLVDSGDPDDDGHAFATVDVADDDDDTDDAGETWRCPNGHAIAEAGMECPLCHAQAPYQGRTMPAPVPAVAENPFALDDDDRD